MTLTGCIVHGLGVFLYLADEGMGTGANWTLEVVSLLHLIPTKLKKKTPGAPTFYLQPGSQDQVPAFSEAMRSIDRAYGILQAKNAPFPAEFLGKSRWGKYTYTYIIYMSIQVYSMYMSYSITYICIYICYSVIVL